MATAAGSPERTVMPLPARERPTISGRRVFRSGFG
jgi:hypothetical protein